MVGSNTGSLQSQLFLLKPSSSESFPRGKDESGQIREAVIALDPKLPSVTIVAAWRVLTPAGRVRYGAKRRQFKPASGRIRRSEVGGSSFGRAEYDLQLETHAALHFYAVG
jgi:hypothetical protein